MSLAVSNSFEYLCYGSTITINMFTLRFRVRVRVNPNPNPTLTEFDVYGLKSIPAL